MRIAMPLFLLLLLVPCVAFAQGQVATKLAATSSRAARAEATQAIPWAQLQATDSQAVQHIVQNASLYRRLPTEVIRCDPELFTLMLDRPELLVGMWRTMEISKVALRRIDAKTYAANDGNGTEGTIHVLEKTSNNQAQNRALVYCEGGYQGKPFLRPIRAKCVMLLRSGSAADVRGKPHVTARVDSFVLFEQAGADFVARTLSPLFGPVADKNFSQTLQFIESFSKSAELRPDGVERLANRLSEVTPQARQALVVTSRGAAERAGMQEQSLVSQKATRALRPVSLNPRAGR